MKAKPVLRDRTIYADGWLVERVIWSVPNPVPPSEHRFKYRLFAGVDGKRMVGFDNERGKGDHMHLEGREFDYQWQGIEKLLEDFRIEVRKARSRR